MEWTGARYADAPTVELTIWIDSSAEHVWGVVTALEGLPALSDELQAIEWCDGATTPEVGARFVGHSEHTAIGTWSTTSTIVECAAPTALAWAVGDPDDPAAVWRFSLERVDGGTWLTYRAQLGPGRSGLTPAIEKMPDKEQQIVFGRLREFEAGISRTLSGIKERAEAICG
ncbi:SRPBCC family protein [Pseudonocardia sp. N23]|uniref:SRPBCC family protein n=1 Tax=Pseudonocardia sp. N23 TaxID=1987376 RepID=UPI000BFCC828|nr:SRPBCC family protein [Pseudonocardia sp. N23]